MSTGDKTTEEKNMGLPTVRELSHQSYLLTKKLMYERARQYVAEGKPVCWMTGNTSGSTYQMICEALDIPVLHMDHYGALCAVKGVAIPLLDYCQKDFLGNTMCGYMRAVYGHILKMWEARENPTPELPQGGWARPPAMMVARSLQCDGTIKFFHAIAKYYDVPVWHVDNGPLVAHINMEEYLSHFGKYQYEEFKAFAKFAEQVSGKKLDLEKLAEIFANHEEKNRYWSQIYQLRKHRPCPMGSRDQWGIVAAGFWLDGRKETTELFRQLYEVTKYRIENKIGDIPEEKYRLMWFELPAWYNLELLDYFNGKGASFVIESQWYAAAMEPFSFPSGMVDPLEKLAWEYIDFARRIVPQAEKESKSWRVQYYLKMAQEWDIDGAVVHPLLTCRNSVFLLKHSEDALRKFLKIPSLRIQGDIVDSRTMLPLDQLKPQVDAFLEMVEHYKGLKQKEGLAQ